MSPQDRLLLCQGSVSEVSMLRQTLSFSWPRNRWRAVSPLSCLAGLFGAKLPRAPTRKCPAEPFGAELVRLLCRASFSAK